MRKTIFLGCVVGFFIFLASESKAQQPVSLSERRTVVKAIETKIAELEVRRAMNLATGDQSLTDEQLVNLRKRLAELLGVRRANVAGRRTSNQRSLMEKAKNSGEMNSTKFILQ